MLSLNMWSLLVSPISYLCLCRIEESTCIPVIPVTPPGVVFVVAPSVPQNLSAVAEGNNTVLISWDSISGQQDDCQLWLRDPRNSSLPWRHSLGTGQVQHLLQGLIPGRNYSVSLSCVAGPYWSSTKPLAVPMGGYTLPRGGSGAGWKREKHLGGLKSGWTLECQERHGWKTGKASEVTSGSLWLPKLAPPQISWLPVEQSRLCRSALVDVSCEM